jgi:hypothetical protein
MTAAESLALALSPQWVFADQAARSVEARMTATAAERAVQIVDRCRQLHPTTRIATVVAGSLNHAWACVSETKITQGLYFLSQDSRYETPGFSLTEWDPFIVSEVMDGTQPRQMDEVQYGSLFQSQKVRMGSKSGAGEDEAS